MKRLTTAIVLVLALALTTTSAFAAKKPLPAVRAALYDTSAVCNPYTLGAATKSKVNIYGPDWKYALKFDVQLVHLVPLTTYEFWVRNLTGYTGPVGQGDTAGGGWYRLLTFMTDEEGEAEFWVKVPKRYLPTGTYPIQVAIDLPGCTKLATKEAVYTLVMP